MKLKLKNVDTMTVRFACEDNELDSLAEFLEKKAAEGWELSSKTGVVLGFRRSKARVVKVSVELVYADDHDSDNERLIEYCEAAGWRHIFSDGKIQIFETDDLAAEPIHTDPVVKLETIHRREKKLMLWLPMATFVLNVIIQGYLWVNFDYGYFLENKIVLLMFIMPVLILFVVLQVISYLHWYLNAKKIVAGGQSPDYGKKWFTRITEKILLPILLVLVWGDQLMDAYFSGERMRFMIIIALCTLCVLFAPFFSLVSARFGKRREGNLGMYILVGIILAIVASGIAGAITANTGNDEYVQVDGSYQMVSLDELPLTMEDLGIETAAYADRYCDKGGSVFVRYMECDDFSDNRQKYWLSYKIYLGNAKKLSQWFMEERKEFMEFSRIEDEKLGAKTIYAVVGDEGAEENKRLLEYDDRIIWLNTNIPLNDSQKQTFSQKLLAVEE